jgi:hypothetical protein
MPFDRRRFLQLLAGAGALVVSPTRAASYTPAPRIYRCDDCPCCSFMGDLVLLKAMRSGRLFAYAPCCGIAFGAPTRGVDAIRTPADFAPEGFVLADADDIAQAVREGWNPTDEGPVEEWWGPPALERKRSWSATSNQCSAASQASPAAIRFAGAGENATSL